MKVLATAAAVLLLTLSAASAWAQSHTEDFAQCQAGRIDNFDASDGVEAASPSPALLATLHRVSTSSPRNFDVCAENHYFVHTISGCPIAAAVDSLVLQIHLRGTGSQAHTDLMYLGVDGNVLWGLRMNTLQSVHTHGLDQSWDNGDTAVFVLNLGALPASDAYPVYGPRYPAGVTDLYAAVRAAGTLDVLVADDTCVDYLLLNVDAPTPVHVSSWGSVKVHYR